VSRMCKNDGTVVQMKHTTVRNHKCKWVFCTKLYYWLR